MTNEEAEQRGHDAAMTTTDEALLPCPFCGKQAKDDFYEAYSTDSSYDFIGCSDDDFCRARIPYGGRRERNTAIIAWNRRASQQSADERVKVLEAEVERLRYTLQRMLDTCDEACDPAWVKRIARAALGEKP